MSLSLVDITALVNDKLSQQEKAFKREIADISSSIVKNKIDEHDKKLRKILDDQKNEIHRLKEENKDLLNRINVLEKDSSIAFVELEETQRLAYSTDQYVRRNNIEISGISSHCDDENLEDVVIELINKMSKEAGQPSDDTLTDISHDDIEACHRLNSKDKNGNKTTIVRFVNRKICEDAHTFKKNINSVNMEELGDSVKNIYVNDNLNKYYKELSAKCRRLKKKNKIKDTWCYNGVVSIKLNDDFIKHITHKNDLDKMFPNFVYFSH